MPVSSDLVRISIGEEGADDYGSETALPTTFYELPITSEGMMPEVQVSLSNLQSDNRQVLDSLLNGINAQGDISTELVICPALKLVLESAMANDVDPAPAPVGGADPANMEEVKVGVLQKSLVVVKRFPDPEGTPDVDFLYHIITGVVVNTLNVNTSPGSPVAYGLGLIGKEYVVGATGDTGLGEAGIIDIVDVATATPVVDPVVLRSPDVVNLQFGGAPLTDAALGRCFGNFGFTLNNNYRGIQCIGSLFNKNVAIGRCEVDLTATVHFSDNLLMEAVLAQSEHTMLFRVQKADSPITTFEGMFSSLFPRMKFAGDSVVAGGTGTDVVNDLSMNALYDSSEESTLTIQWGDSTLEPV
ncbi:MAG: hypothetical protein JRJ45_00535 [Deltaproteobacteria bacterium]|nr:hypothetical protein [Deltaproteobacteria bacterium]